MKDQFQLPKAKLRFVPWNPFPERTLVMRKIARTFALLFAALVVGTAARADTLTYNFIASNTPEGIVSTSLPASPTPLSFTTGSFQITVPLIVDGDPLTIPVDFYTAASGGGAGGQGVRVEGPTLFTGLTSSPTFLTGTFAFGDFNLTISPQPSAVPEPSSLFLFGSGALLSGLLIRKFRIFAMDSD
jgi:hypothetical protein